MADNMLVFKILDVNYDFLPSFASVGIQFRSPHSLDQGSHIAMSCLRI